MSMVEESDVWINIRSTPSATGNDLVLDNGNWIINIMEGSVWLDDESKREL